jgi:hypothetical protein
MQIIFIIQIKYKISITISAYFLLVSIKKHKFPDYSKIGFYYRYIYDKEKKKLFKIPIQRYKCKQKNKKECKGKHKTFSLLPYPVIPYKKYCIFITLEIAKKKHINNETIIDIWTDISVEYGTEIGFCSIILYLRLFEHTVKKLCIFLKKEIDEIYKYLLGLDVQKLNKMIFNYYAITKDFLFGIPSHKRVRVNA